jgi:hypothetical protein
MSINHVLLIETLSNLDVEGGRGYRPPLHGLCNNTFLIFLILNHEKIGVKFNKRVIIKSKSMNGHKMFVGGWDMQDIVKDMVMTRSGNYGITNMVNVYTWSIGCMNLILAKVGVMHGELVHVRDESYGQMDSSHDH